LDVFVAICSETDALPIAAEKALWNPQAWVVEESKIAAAESRWRGRADEAASQLVKITRDQSVAENHS
jgi:hypothetical protein